ncbi:MAG: hypothetical protein GF334_00670 [Candidatus Altiarchaeales archaeon]|nr:hypothetical protein [Candidatus Altiarchaeales archaeon]
MKSPIDIEGWTDGRILEHLQDFARGKYRVLEIGVWKGRSTIAMAQSITGVIYAIDHFLGSPGERETNHREAVSDPLGVYLDFLANIKEYGVGDKVIPMMVESHKVQFYLRCWSLLKPAGVMCGDDFGWKGVKEAVVEFFIERKHGQPMTFVDDKMWVVKKHN